MRIITLFKKHSFKIASFSALFLALIALVIVGNSLNKHGEKNLKKEIGNHSIDGMIIMPYNASYSPNMIVEKHGNILSISATGSHRIVSIGFSTDKKYMVVEVKNL
jgi:hypothetical protein